MANTLDSNSMDLPPLVEGDVYITIDGAQSGAIFQYKFGHRRQFLTMDDFAPYKRRVELKRILITDAARIPVGPAMPRSHAITTKNALSASDNIDQIREAFCREFQGRGYEIGAGERPTIVPERCHVTYVDRFTFEEARDGSFRNKTSDNFVKVSIYEPLEQLASITDESSDFFIACHVLEHCTDVIGCFREVHRKLRKGGHMFFVLPDKRHMFDSARPVTTLEHFIGDSIYGADAPTLDHYLEYCRRSEKRPDWLNAAVQKWHDRKDNHHHVFTPESTRELLSFVASDLQLSSWSVEEAAHVSKTQEFYITATK